MIKIFFPLFVYSMCYVVKNLFIIRNWRNPP